MNRHIVVAFRMPSAAMTPGPEGAYLSRARALCARGEALGGRLVAWSAAIIAMAWDTDSIEEAVLLATSTFEEAGSFRFRPGSGKAGDLPSSPRSERAWAVGIAEGELEPLSPDGARMQLAWGQALLQSTTLSRVARGGEVLVDGEMRALRAGQLSLLGARTATDSGIQVRGWRLDVERPWKRPSEEAPEVGIEEIEEIDEIEEIEEMEVVSVPEDAKSPEPDRNPAGGPHEAPTHADPAGATLEMPLLEFDGPELSTAEVLEIVEASASLSAMPPVRQKVKRGGRLAHRVRRLAGGDKSTEAMEAIVELRRERARAEEAGTPSSRCQAALALAMTLAIAGRAEDALLEALDALGRAREARDPKAIDACTALLAKLYSGSGHPSEASALLRGA
jgi:hypothetical protein